VIDIGVADFGGAHRFGGNVTEGPKASVAPQRL
jgi:hypothetical protein